MNTTEDNSITAWHTGLFLWSWRGFYDVCVSYIKLCYLGVVGTRKNLQVNKILACVYSQFVFLPIISPSFLSPRVSHPLLYSTFHSLPFSPCFYISLSFLALPVSLWPCSSRAWEKLTVVSPENLSELREGWGWRYLTQHIHTTADILFFFYFKEKRLMLEFIILIFD